jgi:hypothetical protein
MRLLPIVLLLAGCPSPGLVKGLTGVRSQQGYSMVNTAQKCIDAKRAVEIADIALAIYLYQLSSAGYIKDREVIEDNTFAVCLLPSAEPCRGGGWTRGPFGPTLPGEKYPLAARKRGCASRYAAWSAKQWPPVCRDVWKDEPHCVTADKVSEANWEKNYVHELYNMAVLRWTDVYKPDYRHDIYKVIGPNAKKLVLEMVK